MSLTTLLLIIIAVACGVIVLALVSAGITAIVWGPAVLKAFADRNLFITSVPEGTGKALLRGGKFRRFLTSKAATDPVPEHNWDLTKVENKEPGLWYLDTHGKRRNELLIIRLIDSFLPGGMRWVGIPFIDEIYTYNFRWSVLRETKPLDTEDGLVKDAVQMLDNGKWIAAFSKRIDNIYLRDTSYFFEIVDAETRGAIKMENDTDRSAGVPVKLYMVATVRIINPFLALFRTHDWLATTLNYVRPSIRAWVARTPFQEVMCKPEAAQYEHDILLQSHGLPDDVIKTSGKDPKTIQQYIEEEYGVRYKRLGMDDLIAPREYQEAITKRSAAEQDKFRTITVAQGDAKKAEILAGGEQQRLVIVARGEAKSRKIIAKGEADALKLQADVLKDNPDAQFVLAAQTLSEIGKEGNTVFMGGGNATIPMMINAIRPKKEVESGQPQQ